MGTLKAIEVKDLAPAVESVFPRLSAIVRGQLCILLKKILAIHPLNELHEIRSMCCDDGETIYRHLTTIENVLTTYASFHHVDKESKWNELIDKLTQSLTVGNGLATAN